MREGGCSRRVIVYMKRDEGYMRRDKVYTRKRGMYTRSDPRSFASNTALYYLAA